MRISDWSSDVCSSDLPVDATIAPASPATVHRGLNGVLEVIPFLQLGDLTVHKERRSAAHPESTPLLEVRLHPLCRRRRSEEHTSELQSLMRISYAVFCLKKKKKQQIHQNNNNELHYRLNKNNITNSNRQ